jgi:hypothetical protein
MNDGRILKKVTGPLDMQADLTGLEAALIEFEKKFKDEDRGSSYYHLVINGELSKAVCKEVRRIYTEAGWIKVQCRTSSDNDERPGLTGLKLETNV